MIFAAPRLRMGPLGAILVFVVSTGCGSAADSSGRGGTHATNSGGATTSAGAANAAGSGQNTAGSGSGQQAGASAGGAAGNAGSSSGGADSVAGSGGTGGVSPGGSSGSGGGGEPGTTPEVWTACTDSNECVLTPMSCCGSCGAVTPEDAAAVNSQHLAEFREAACGGPGICPACIGEDDPRVGTYCNDGHCVVELALD